MEGEPLGMCVKEVNNVEEISSVLPNWEAVTVLVNRGRFAGPFVLGRVLPVR